MMRVMNRVLVALALIGLCLSAFYSVWAQDTDKASDKTFQRLQDILNKEKAKKKVVSRYEVVEGERGVKIEDISLTLLDYSYHIINDSGPQPFVTVRCRRDISRYEKQAEQMRGHFPGRYYPNSVQLPDAERTILGVIDLKKDEFITLLSLPKSVKAIVQFAELRKKKPEYIISSLIQAENCTDCTQYKTLNTTVMSFDEKNKIFYNVLEVQTFRSVDKYDDLDASSGYTDRSTISWSDWVNSEYRNLIITTDREILEPKEATKAAFKNKKEIYSWVNNMKLSLIDRIVDGKSTMSHRKNPPSVGRNVTLRDGELYETNVKDGTRQITYTNGKIKSFLLSPNNRYVAYSKIVGYTDDAGLYEPDEKIPQVPVCHIIVLDLDSLKQLRELKPQSAQDEFVEIERWISNEELTYYDANGITADFKYIYNAGINELRRAGIDE